MGPALTVSSGRLSASQLSAALTDSTTDSSDNNSRNVNHNRRRPSMDGDKSLVDAEVQIAELVNQLEHEREDRVEMEKEVSRILRGYKKKHQEIIRQKDDEINKLQEYIHQQHEKYVDLEITHQETIEEIAALKEHNKKIRDEMRQQELDRFRAPSPLKYSRACSPRPPTTPKTPKSDSVLARENDTLKCHVDDVKKELDAKDLEVKRAKERVEFVRELNIELREKNRELDKELREVKDHLANAKSEISAKYSDKITTLSREIDSLEKKVSEKDSEISKLNSTITDLRNSIAAKDREIKRLDEEVKDYKSKCERYRQEKQDEMDKEKSKLLGELRMLRENLDKKCEDYQKQVNEKELLKKTCLEIENQADQYDKLLTKKEEEYQKLLRERQKLELDRDSLKLEVKKLQVSTQNDKTKFELETTRLSDKMKRLEEDLTIANNKVRSLRKELDQERNANDVNVRRVRTLEEELDRCVAEANAAEERTARVEEEIREIKEEAARHISEVLAEKSRGNQLKSMLQEAKERNEQLETRIDAIITEMEQERHEYDTEIYRLNERLRQHLQLENEMSNRLEKLEHKKKPLIGISPRPPRSAPRSAGFIKNVAQFEQELEKERERTRRLQNELIRTETELQEIKMQAKMKPLLSVHNHHDLDSLSHESRGEPSAPPPPYGTVSVNGHYAVDDAHSVSSLVSRDDNNIEITSSDDTDSLIQRFHTVSVDVHRASSSNSRDSHHPPQVGGNPIIRRQEFSFTPSILEEIESDDPHVNHRGGK